MGSGNSGDTSSPLVTVIIPSFNSKDYLKEAIDSVLAQTYSRYEVIVVDDGSTTGSVERICAAYGSRVRYVRQANQGQAAARNHGIKISAGEYVAFLDDDDLWMPEKLEKQVKLYEDLRRRGVNVGLVYTGQEYVEMDGRLIKKILYRSSGGHFLKLIFLDYIGTPSSVLIHRDVIKNVGDFSVELQNTEDFDLWLRIGIQYEIHSVNEHLIRYRNQPGSVSKNAEKKNQQHTSSHQKRGSRRRKTRSY